MTARRLMTFAIMLSATVTSACVTSTTAGSETENEICRVIGSALPTRSRADTQQTQDEIQQIYADFSLACPAWGHLIPA